MRPTEFLLGQGLVPWGLTLPVPQRVLGFPWLLGFPAPGASYSYRARSPEVARVPQAPRVPRPRCS
eukprot:9470182-Pyramimonas_sp.AAC.1